MSTRTLRGERCLLRPLRQADAPVTLPWRNDPELRDNILGYRFPVTREREDAWYAQILQDRGQQRADYAIECLTDGTMVGMTQLMEIDWIARHARFGMIIGDKTRQGQGLAGEAMRLLFGYGFGGLNLRRLHLRVAAYNLRALALYQRFGFCEEGRLREHLFLDGRYHDLILMGLMRDDYAARASIVPPGEAPQTV